MTQQPNDKSSSQQRTKSNNNLSNDTNPHQYKNTSTPLPDKDEFNLSATIKNNNNSDDNISCENKISEGENHDQLGLIIKEEEEENNSYKKVEKSKTNEKKKKALPKKEISYKTQAGSYSYEREANMKKSSVHEIVSSNSTSFREISKIVVKTTIIHQEKTQIETNSFVSDITLEKYLKRKNNNTDDFLTV